jgi:hypothetical protein
VTAKKNGHAAGAPTTHACMCVLQLAATRFMLEAKHNKQPEQTSCTGIPCTTRGHYSKAAWFSSIK